MTILVTGGSGFLGTCLVKNLRKNGGKVISLSSKDADLCDSNSLNQYSNIKFEKIYHLAAWTQAGDFCLHHLGEQWIINQQINTTVLKWWAESQPQAKLISMGTSCAYEEGIDLREEFYLQGSPIKDLYTYAMTKRMMYIGQQSLAKQYGLKFLTVVPSTLYGPDYHLDGKQMHFIFDLAWKILSSKYYGDDIVLWGDGYQRREIVFLDDFIRDLFSLEKIVENDVVNIGANSDYSIREFAETLCNLTGVDSSKIKYDETRYVGSKVKRLCTKKEKALLGKLERIDLKEGLGKMLFWLEPKFVEHTSKVSKNN